MRGYVRLTVAVISSVFLTLFCHVERSYAQISVEGLYHYFDPSDAPVRNIVVRNAGDRALLVVAEALKVERPGQEGERRVETDEIIISPKRFTVAAKGSRLARLLIRRFPEDSEQIYRITFAPQDAEEFDEDIPKSKPNQRQMVIRILSGMGVMVFVRPKESSYRVDISRSNGLVTLKNLGNVSTLLDKFRACPTDDKSSNSCSQFPAKRLYPGGELALNVRNDMELTFDRRLKTFRDTITVPANLEGPMQLTNPPG